MNIEDVTHKLEYLETTIDNPAMFSWFVAELVNVYNDSLCYEYQLYTQPKENIILSEAITRVREILRGFVLSLVSGGFNIPGSNLGELTRAFDAVWDFHVLEGKTRGYLQVEAQRKKVELTV